MPRRALARGLTAAATAIVLGAALAPAMVTAAAGAAYADSLTEPETVVPAGSRWLPQQETLYAAGSGGYLAADETGQVTWTDEAAGTQTPAASSATPVVANQDVQAVQVAGTPVTVRLTDYAAGTTATLTVPSGQTWISATSRDSVLTADFSPGTKQFSALHVIGSSGGQTTDRPVTGLPSDPTLLKVAAQNGSLAVVEVLVGGAPHSYLVDYGTAAAQEIFAGVPAAAQYGAVIGSTRVVTYQPGGTAYSLPLSNLAGTVEQTPLPAALAGDGLKPVPVPVGSRMVFVRTPNTPTSPPLALLSVPIGGGTATTVLALSGSSYAVTPDGSVLVTGGTGPDDWAVRRVGADGTVTRLRTVPPIPAHIYGLTYSGGRLVYSTDTGQYDPLVRRDVPAGANPSVGAAATLLADGPDLVPCGPGVSCAVTRGLGDGTVAYVEPGSDLVKSPLQTGGFYEGSVGPNDGRMTDAAGDYAVVNTPSNGTQYVIDFRLAGTGSVDDVLLTRPITASAVWGTTLWVPGSTAGSVRPYDLRTGAYGTAVQTGAPCASPDELQAAGRWLYWSCGASGPAGVYDLTSQHGIAVPAGPALLGDGYLVRHDTAAGTLVLTDVSSGTAVTGTLAAVPASGIADDRDITWSVDPFGGGVAYTNAGQNIHVVPLVGIARGGLSAVAAHPDGSVTAPSLWHGDWDFSRPTGSWTFTVRTRGGLAVYSTSGTARQGTRIAVGWNLKDAAGRPVPDGFYTTALTAQPADGQGGPASTTAALRVHGDPDAPRDYTDDGAGDLLALTSGGRLDIRPGSGTGPGAVNPASASGTGWSAAATYVPINDLNGDGCNDLLVRDSGGYLTRYNGRCTTALSPSLAHQYIGAGWNVYNQLTSPGDLTGDGRADLLARTPGGDLYLYKGLSTGLFATRVRIGWGYQIYPTIVGAQDLNGDRIGDVLARDTSGVLWRYQGDGKGGLLARVRIGAGWNAYNSLVGVGDLNGDGRADLIARDASGNLWRYNGTGSGLFAPRAQIGWGWQTYKSLM